SDTGERPLDEREAFRTQGGRTVYGGGGITPDLIVAPQDADTIAVRFQQALGSGVPRFRDALVDYALAVKAARRVTARDFEVTPAMLDELWARMEAKNVGIGRAAYDDATPVVSRFLGYEIARYVFGQEAEFLRRVRFDRTIAATIELASGATAQRELFERAAERRKAKREDVPSR
ncbi:MAG: hypothetical protein M3373_11395, partial [Gemmatimonadota bacterium]|nr:hypothetical protein [Gemmatimonadota bacterium]